jgi:hypothetical protein
MMQSSNGVFRLGNPNGWGKFQKLGAIARRRKADEN